MSDPNTITGLVLRVSGTVGAYKDAGRTLSATANGDTVLSVTDQVGTATGITASGVTIVKQPSAFNNQPGLRIAPNGYIDLGNPATLNSAVSGSYTVYAIFRARDQGFRPLFSKGPTLALYLAFSSTGLGRYPNSNAGVSIGSNRPNMVSYTFAATSTNVGTEQWRRNGVNRPAAAFTTGTAFDGSNFNIGSYNQGGFTDDVHDIYELLVYSSVLSDADLAALDDYATTTYGPYTQPLYDGTSPYRVIFDGNSLFVFGNPTWPSKVASTLGLSENAWANFGYGGRSTPTQDTDAMANIDTLSRTGFGKDIYVWYEETNYGSGGSPLPGHYNDTVACCQHRADAGYIPVVTTCLPSGSPTTGRTAYNDALRADFGVATANPRVWLANPGVTYARVLCDCAADPIMGQGEPANPSYWNDGIHPNDAGYTQLTPDLAFAVQQAVAYDSDNSSSSTSSLSSASSDSSSHSSPSSPSSASTLSSASSSSSSSHGYSESSSSEGNHPPLHDNPAQNTFPSVLINDDDPGQITKIDEMVYQIAPSAPFTGPVTVDLASFYADSEIRYTLTSRNPTNHSPLYTGPLTITRNLLGGNTVIKARIYDKTNSNKKGKIIKITFRVIPPR